MSIVKSIEIRTVTSRVGNAFIRKTHYSGKVVSNSQLHFGAFLNGVLHGVMQFGPSMDKSKLQGLVADTGWNEFIELNRLAFDGRLPKNSESRCIAIAMKQIKKHAPHIKWVVSFADGTQCGDGTIYRAAGFVLTGIGENSTIYELPNGERMASLTLTANWNIPAVAKICSEMGVPHVYRTMSQWEDLGAKKLRGYMMRYVYFIDKPSRYKLTTPELPYSLIGEMGAKMYRGERQELESKAVGFQPTEGGAVPTLTHQLVKMDITSNG